LIIPEAVSLGAAEHKTVCENAITQAHDMKDRFAVLDVRIDDPSKKDLVEADITAFRGISKEYEFLRYGPAIIHICVQQLTTVSNKLRTRTLT
jgi:hypothetical protein